MAKSSARKVRDKRIREGKMDAGELRSPFALADLRTRKTKTKREELGKIKHKNLHKETYRNPNFTGGDQGSFCLMKKIKKGVDEKNLAC
ncbi:hypothetical protein GCM10010969_19360 [Saccharibacillus kuerlensis]|uniref:Uncharacterized protein n=1 Tax=Saccharibacillus kuerlensis TaxID=459527 RepID=A0ABQ2L183_9BACL|nr:hypothetical protein GCM10010969_19360 [Saccharibacillus kuerlensis]